MNSRNHKLVWIIGGLILAIGGIFLYSQLNLSPELNNFITKENDESISREAKLEYLRSEKMKFPDELNFAFDNLSVEPQQLHSYLNVKSKNKPLVQEVLNYLVPASVSPQTLTTIQSNLDNKGFTSQLQKLGENTTLLSATKDRVSVTVVTNIYDADPAYYLISTNYASTK